MVVGNLPAKIKDIKKDTEIEVVLLPEMSESITQAQFSVLSSQYIVALTQNKESGDCKLRYFNLQSNGLAEEVSYAIKRDTVCFSQAPAHSIDMQTLDIFQVTTITKRGEIHSLCPIVLQEMVFAEEHFSSILIALQDMIEEKDGQET